MSNKKLLADSFLISSGRMLSRFLGLVSTFIVARILLPEDYAVIATAMVVQDLALRLQDVGFNQNLISSKDQSTKFISTVFWTRTLVAFVLSILLFIFAPQFAGLLNSPQSESVIRVICWCIFLGSTVNVNVVLAMRAGDFMPEFKINVASKIISVIVTIYLAYYLNNYWALAIGMLLSSLLTFLFGYVVCNKYPLVKPSLTMMRDVFGYSKWYLLLQFVDFSVSKLFIFSIGRYIGERMLGAYSLMASIGFMYSFEVAAAFDKANLTHLVRNLNVSNFKEASEAIFKNLNYVYAVRDNIIIPVYIYVFFYSELVTRIFLGEQWVFAKEVLTLISISAIVISYNAVAYTIFNAIRRPNFVFYCSCYRFIGFALSAYWGVTVSSVSSMQTGAIITELGLLTALTVFGIKYFSWKALATVFRAVLTISVFLLIGYTSQSLTDNSWYGSFMYGVATLLVLCLRYFIGDQFLRDIFKLRK